MQEMKIRYGGDNTIDANTYINSLLHFTNIVEEVNKAISDEQKVEVRIKANEPGSFIVDLIVWCQDNQDGIKRIFTKENMSYAREVVKTVGEAYKVAKHLLGKKPKEIKSDGEGLQIQNVAGNFQYFDLRGANLYLKNPIIKEAIAQEFETLEMDKSVTNIELLDENDNEIQSGSYGGDDDEKVAYLLTPEFKFNDAQASTVNFLEWLEYRQQVWFDAN